MKYLRRVMPVAHLGTMLFLGGCVNSTSYDAMAEAMRNSPALLADRIDACTKSYRASPGATNRLRQTMKLPLGTTDAATAATACRRGMTAIAQGRMSYDDFLTMSAETPRPIVMRIMQGR